MEKKLGISFIALCICACIGMLIFASMPQKVKNGTAIITANNGNIVYSGEIDKKLYYGVGSRKIEVYTKDGTKYTTDISNVVITEKK